MPLLSGSRLFTRFFLALLVMALSLTLVLGVVFFLERSRAMAELVVDRWRRPCGPRPGCGRWTTRPVARHRGAAARNARPVRAMCRPMRRA
jgi:hypothetical protein